MWRTKLQHTAALEGGTKRYLSPHKASSQAAEAPKEILAMI